jgi:hypothetical protein
MPAAWPHLTIPPTSAPPPLLYKNNSTLKISVQIALADDGPHVELLDQVPAGASRTTRRQAGW